jgi:hypothetical protein
MALPSAITAPGVGAGAPPGKFPAYQETTPEIQDLQGQIRDSQQKLDTTLQPLREQRTQIETSITSAPPLVEPPKLAPLPQFQPRQVSPEDAQQFMGLSLAVASLAALATRRPLTTALNSAASAMDGFRQGNLEQGKRDIENFNTQYNAAYRQNAQMLQEYNTILQNQQFSIQQKMQMLQVVAGRERDEIALAQLQTGNLRSFLDLNQKRLDGMNAWNAQAAKFSETASYHAGLLANTQQRTAAQYGAPGQLPGGLSQEAVDNAAAYYILNGRLPIGMARIGPAAINAIQNRAGEMTTKAGMTPEEFAAAGPVTRQKLGALLQLEKMRNGVQAYEAMLDKNVEILKELSAKVNRSDSPYFNKGVLWLEQNAAGDPDVAEYLFQVRTVQTEAARILSNPNLTGQLTDTATQELAQVFGANLNHDQIVRVAERAQADARNRSKSLDNQSAKLIGEVKNPLGRTAPRGAPAAPAAPAAARYTEGQTATGPTGQKLVFRGGQWQPMQ